LRITNKPTKELRLVNRYENGMKTGSPTGGRRGQTRLSTASCVAAALFAELRGRREEVLVQRQEKYES
jgi:hypothetical protein